MVNSSTKIERQIVSEDFLVASDLKSQPKIAEMLIGEAETNNLSLYLLGDTIDFNPMSRTTAKEAKSQNARGLLRILESSTARITTLPGDYEVFLAIALTETEEEIEKQKSVDPESGSWRENLLTPGLFKAFNIDPQSPERLIELAEEPEIKRFMGTLGPSLMQIEHHTEDESKTFTNRYTLSHGRASGSQIVSKTLKQAAEVDDLVKNPHYMPIGSLDFILRTPHLVGQYYSGKSNLNLGTVIHGHGITIENLQRRVNREANDLNLAACVGYPHPYFDSRDKKIKFAESIKHDSSTLPKRAYRLPE